MKQQIIIVDENDNDIGSTDRETIVRGDSRIYRVSALWITNSKGEILLAQRAFTKKHDPGKWADAVDGTVEIGETYESNILKEMEEELGLKGIVPMRGPKVYVAKPYKICGQWFLLTLDKPIEAFTFRKEEVEQIKWFTKEELGKLINLNPEQFVSDMKRSFDLFT